MLSSPVQALTIVIDYTHDTFFAGNAVAKAALEAAAADLSAAVTTPLGAITRDTFDAAANSGPGGNGVNWVAHYVNPETGVLQNIEVPRLAQDEYRVFVGGRPLAFGSAANGGYSTPTASFWFQTDATGTAVTNMNNMSNIVMTRGGGPLIGNITGALGPNGNYNLNFGLTYGHLWFDVDGNNDTVVDDAVGLDAYWSYDHTAPVQPGQNDLYSFALHELLHTIGVGTAPIWSTLRSGATWSGPAVNALLGNGDNVIDGEHLGDSILSPRLSDGVLQSSAITSGIYTGSRKQLTQLDMAILSDIGFTQVPEPSTSVLLTALTLASMGLRRRAAV